MEKEQYSIEKINNTTTKILQNLKTLDDISKDKSYNVPADEELEQIRKNFDDLLLDNKDFAMKELVNWMKVRVGEYKDNDEKYIKGLQSYHNSFSDSITMTLQNMFYEMDNYHGKLHGALDNVSALSIKLEQFYQNMHAHETDDIKFPSLVLTDKSNKSKLSAYSRETLIEQLMQMQEREKYFLDILKTMKINFKTVKQDLEAAQQLEIVLKNKIEEGKKEIESNMNNIKQLEDTINVYKVQDEIRAKSFERMKIETHEDVLIEKMPKEKLYIENLINFDFKIDFSKIVSDFEKINQFLTIEGIDLYTMNNPKFVEAIKKENKSSEISLIELKDENNKLLQKIEALKEELKTNGIETSLSDDIIREPNTPKTGIRNSSNISSIQKTTNSNNNQNISNSNNEQPALQAGNTQLRSIQNGKQTITYLDGNQNVAPFSDKQHDCQLSSFNSNQNISYSTSNDQNSSQQSSNQTTSCSTSNNKNSSQQRSNQTTSYASSNDQNSSQQSNNQTTSYSNNIQVISQSNEKQMNSKSIGNQMVSFSAERQTISYSSSNQSDKMHLIYHMDIDNIVEFHVPLITMPSENESYKRGGTSRSCRDSYYREDQRSLQTPRRYKSYVQRNDTYQTNSRNNNNSLLAPNGYIDPNDPDAVSIKFRSFEAEDGKNILNREKDPIGNENRPITVHGNVEQKKIAGYTLGFNGQNSENDEIAKRFLSIVEKWSESPVTKKGKPIYSKSYRERMAKIAAMRAGYKPAQQHLKVSIVSFGAPMEMPLTGKQHIRTSQLPPLRKRFMGSSRQGDTPNLSLFASSGNRF